MSSIEPIPTAWSSVVVSILKKGHNPDIRWSLRAQTDWNQYGLPYQALQLLIATLEQEDLWGELVIGMMPLPKPPKKAGKQTVYAFLCPGPKGPNSLYAKVGLFENQVTLDLFSFHPDLKGSLIQRIKKAKKLYKS